MGSPVAGPLEPVERARWMVQVRRSFDRRVRAELWAVALVCVFCAWLNSRGVRFALATEITVFVYGLSRLWLAIEGRRRAAFPGEGSDGGY